LFGWIWYQTVNFSNWWVVVVQPLLIWRIYKLSIDIIEYFVHSIDSDYMRVEILFVLTRFFPIDLKRQYIKHYKSLSRNQSLLLLVLCAIEYNNCIIFLLVDVFPDKKKIKLNILLYKKNVSYNLKLIIKFRFILNNWNQIWNQVLR